MTLMIRTLWQWENENDEPQEMTRHIVLNGDQPTTSEELHALALQNHPGSSASYDAVLARAALVEGSVDDPDAATELLVWEAE